ncbi:MAG: PIN domain-containing protein [Dehalococcoidia bacterium]|nr:PIN domain-containing protein [Dehalococcoidia bacterium]
MITRWTSRLSSLQRFGFDTNALIYALEGTVPYASMVAEVLAMMRKGEALGVISTVVELELLVKPFRERDQIALDQVTLMLDDTPNLFIRSLDRSIARRAADMRARTGLSIPDSVIAATALEERCDAIIGNDVDMARRVNTIPYLCLDDYVH